MIPRIKKIETADNYKLFVEFSDGKHVCYDVADDIAAIPAFRDLKTEYGLFQNAQVDKSRTCVYWNDVIDLPSDTIYEYGKAL